MIGARNIVVAMGALCAATTAVWGQEEPPAVPSGLALSLFEVLEETQPNGSLWLRLRFVAPELAATPREAIQTDFDVLCSDYALTYQPSAQTPAEQAVISISSEPIAFGTAAPDVPQYFEAYRLEDGACIWEAF
ncbi:DUF6497 family protein [Pseudooceanicola sp. MF1-13]|uniref:DUF6497 family protein n=1 Tax=Pseudooceanicola sp. MF1-13 TaxID=3379095 RepID=UPI003891DC26